MAYLEGKVEEHSRGYGELREMIIHLDQKIDRFREEIMRSNSVTNQRLDALDQKMSKQFTWLVGMMFAVLLAVIGALLGK